MKPNLKISITVLLCAFLALTLLYSFNGWYRENFDVERWEEMFYAQNFDPDKKKLFLIGSSVAFFINHTYIEQYLNSNEENYDVYNLGHDFNIPKKRIKSLDLIIGAKPDVIVYALGIADLRVDDSIYVEHMIRERGVIPTIQKPQKQWLASVISIVDEKITVKKFFGIDTKNFKNPKYVSLNVIQKLIERKPLEGSFELFPKTPFVHMGDFLHTVTTNEEMSSWKNAPYRDHLDLTGENVLAFKQIVSEITKNNIKLIILVTPHHEFYRNNIPDKELEDFFSLLNEITEKNDIKIINLFREYSDLEIWHDIRHIALDPVSTIYFEDVSREILGG